MSKKSYLFFGVLFCCLLLQFKLAFGGSISGRVTKESDGIGIQGAEVEIIGDVGWVSGTFTDSLGNYFVNGLPARSYYVRTWNTQHYIDQFYDGIIAAGWYFYPPNGSTPVNVDEGADTPNINFSLPLGGAISGRVTWESDGQGIRDVEVFVYDSYWNPVKNTWTNASGDYSIGGFWAGTYYVATSNSPIYIDEFYDNAAGFENAQRIVVVQGGNISNINFSLSLGGSISGRVTRESNGQGIGDVQIIVYDSGGSQVKSGWTDGSGNYSIGGLRTGNHYVRTKNSLGYFDEYYDNVTVYRDAKPVGVLQGIDTPNIDFRLALGGSISGRVTRESEGTGIQGVSITVLDRTFRQAGSAVTDGDGFFFVTTLPTDSYFVYTWNSIGYIEEFYDNIQVTKSTFPWPPSGATFVNVTQDLNTPNINFSLAPAGSISGRVTRQSDGTGIQGIEVSILDKAWNGVISVWSDSSGYYNAGGLLAGGYYVGIGNAQGYIGEYYDNVTSSLEATLVNVTAGADTSNINFSLVTKGSISGRVTRDSDGTGIQGVEVIVSGVNGNWIGSVSTDFWGNYTAGGLATGSYFVRTRNNGSYIDEWYDNIRISGVYSWPSTGATAVSVNQSQDIFDINFGLTLCGSISGRVTQEPDGAAIQGIEVRVYDSNWNSVSAANTDYSGNYTAGGLLTGSYYVGAGNFPGNAQGYVGEYYDNVTSPNSATLVSVTVGLNSSNINFSLARKGSISGRVTRDSDGMGIREVEVMVYGTNENWVTSASTDVLGNYTAGGILTGSYYVRTSNHSGYIDEWYNDKQAKWGAPWPPAGATAVSVAQGMDTPNITFGLVLYGSISGRVTRDPGGSGIQGVQISAYDSNWNAVGYGSTDSAGNYMVSGLLTGSYFLVTSNNLGYLDECYNNVPVDQRVSWPPVGATAVSVTQGMDTPNIAFGLASYGSISGRVTRDSDGTGIMGGRVSVFDSNWNSVNGAYADYSGNYAVSGVPAGSYYVRTSDFGGYIAEWYNNKPIRGGDPWPPVGATAVHVALSANTPDINFGLTMYGSISGRVTRESGGSGIQYVEIRVYDGNWNSVSSVSTDSFGNYSVGGLFTGVYYVRTSNNSGYIDVCYDNVPILGEGGWPPAGATPLSVTQGVNTPGINFSLATKSSISGRVTRESDGTGIQGVNVTIYGAAGNALNSVPTDSLGNYLATGLWAGTYYVRTSNDKGYIDKWYDNVSVIAGGTWPPAGASAVNVIQSANLPNIDLSLSMKGSISGRVTRALGGGGMSGVQISVYDQGWNSVSSASTDPSGNYTLGGLLTGSYYVRTWAGQDFIDEYYNNIPVKWWEFAPPFGVSTVNVVQGSNMPNINFALTMCGVISGEVIRELDRTGIDGVQVSAYDSSWNLVNSASSDYFGKYAVHRIPAGSYYLRTWNNGGYLDVYYDHVTVKSAAIPVHVNEGSTTPNVNFTLVVELAGTVPVDYDGDRITDVSIYRPNTGGWYILPSSTGKAYYIDWGGDVTDIPVPGDYDGDGKTDIAIYTKSTGTWWIMPSSIDPPYAVGWGGPGFAPVPGDYDGDGKTDVAIYDTTTGAWWIIPSSGAPAYGKGWGGPGFTPVPGDYDGDGATDIAIYESSTGTWWINPASGAPAYGVGWGGPGFTPVPGDYDGDGKTDVAIYDTTTGAWWIIPSSGASAYGKGWGGPGFTPVPGDYDGDGATDIAIYESSTGAWWMVPSSGAPPYGKGWGGDANDIPICTNLSLYD